MKNILIVVDVQNGFNRSEQTHNLVDKIVELTNNGLFDKIIATRFRNKEGSQYTEFLNWHRLIDRPDIELVNGIKADVVIDKWIYTCINDEFMLLLNKLNDGEMPTHLFICGADTDCCVLKTATDIFEKGLMPIVLTEYCDSNAGPKSHDAGLLVMGRLIGKKCLVSNKIASKEDIAQIIATRQYNLQ